LTRVFKANAKIQQKCAITKVINGYILKRISSQLLFKSLKQLFKWAWTICFRFSHVIKMQKGQSSGVEPVAITTIGLKFW